MNNLQEMLENDYDSEFLLQLILFKLRKMQKFFESDKTHLRNSDEVASQIKLTADALGRYLKNDYFSEEYAELYEKNGKLELLWEPYDDENDELVGFEFPDSDDSPAAFQRWKDLNDAALVRRNVDFNLVFNMLKKHLREWWD